MVKKLIDKLKLSIKNLNKAEVLEVLLLGNRVATLTNAYFFGNALKYIVENKEISGAIEPTAYGFLLLFALGTNTLYSYARTKEHIQKNGEPTPKFLRKVMSRKKSLEYLFFGYCQNQGAYLACRNYGCLDEFREVRRESNNLIPNF